ncbi:MAG: TrmH family RNA methyltransferase [Lachnospiraceae bacterium]
MGKSEIITSQTNSRIKKLTALLKKARERREEGVFVCEGKKMFLEVLCQFPERIQEAYFTPEAYEELESEYGKNLKRVSCQLVDSVVFRHIAETVTPQGVMAVVTMPEYTIDSLCDDRGIRLLVLDDLRDPGNLGTIIRTAEAAGMTGILLSAESVDVTNPKVVRSTMGALLRVPIFYTGSIIETLELLKKKHPDFKVFSSALDSSVPYTQADFGQCYGIVVGNEANGVSRQVIEYSDGCIRIPMEGKVESLNASVAAALLMYQAKNSSSV